MRPLSTALAERLATGATTLAHVWIITLRDARRFAFTDHDQPLTFEGLTAPPASGLTPLEIETGDGLAPDLAGAEGALSAEAMTAEDLAGGHWDGAEVRLHRVDWRDPTVSVALFAGRLGEIRRIDGRFVAELRGLKAGLDRPIGRVYARSCDADFGDARCGLNLADPQFSGASCDRAFATCRDRFQNAHNFRGFPHMPGADALLAPVADGAKDGSARWTP